MKNGCDMPDNRWHAAVFDFKFLHKKDSSFLFAGPQSCALDCQTLGNKRDAWPAGAPPSQN